MEDKKQTQSQCSVPMKNMSDSEINFDEIDICIKNINSVGEKAHDLKQFTMRETYALVASIDAFGEVRNQTEKRNNAIHDYIKQREIIGNGGTVDNMTDLRKLLTSGINFAEVMKCIQITESLFNKAYGAKVFTMDDVFLFMSSLKGIKELTKYSEMQQNALITHFQQQEEIAKQMNVNK